MISLEGLTKRFGSLTAVDDVTLSVSRGEVLGFLGPNGAGKSTTMKMVTGFLLPTAGKAFVCGFDVEENPIEAKARIGYLPEGAPLYGDMTARSFLDFIADIRGLRGEDKKRRMDDAIAKVEIADVLHQRIETLSKGYKRRVGLAQAILHDPEVLILDEPTDGLDPNQKHQVRSLISAMARDKAIVISTHILEEVGAVCTRAMVIAKGKVVFDGTPAALEARSRTHNAVTIRLEMADAGRVAGGLSSVPWVERIETISEADGAAQLLIIPRGGKSIIADLSRMVRDFGVPVEEMHVERGRLDDVFRELTMSQ
ncbi:MAG: ABC transporter ATP-binding protein [Alphaproteobacteria bacterium]